MHGGTADGRAASLPGLVEIATIDAHLGGETLVVPAAQRVDNDAVRFTASGHD